MAAPTATQGNRGASKYADERRKQIQGKKKPKPKPKPRPKPY